MRQELTLENLHSHIVGKKIVSADTLEKEIRLEDGTVLAFKTHKECCASFIPTLEMQPNFVGCTVMNVRQISIPDVEISEGMEQKFYSFITLFGDANEVLGEIYVAGDPGSGYYGLSATLEVVSVRKEDQ